MKIYRMAYFVHSQSRKCCLFLACLAILLIVNQGSLYPAYAGAGMLNPNGTMNLWVNFRFPPTSSQIQQTKDALTRASEMICDATEGQVRLGVVHLTGGAVNEDQADIWIHPEIGRSGVSIFPTGNLSVIGAHIDLYSNAIWGDIIAHELSHHAFGLGDQYDEQRRNGGACGIGPGFESVSIDERNHTIMQQSGYLQCVGGTSPGKRCNSNPECTGDGTCTPVLMSEFSVRANHDPLQGDNRLCPLPTATTRIELKGYFDKNTMPISGGFDDTDFATAETTSNYQQTVKVIDSKGGLPEHELKLYFENTGVNVWNLHIGSDEAEFANGTKGKLIILGAFVLIYNSDGSFNAMSGPYVLDITGGTTGRVWASGADDQSITFIFDRLTQSTRPSIVQSEDLDGFAKCGDKDCAQRWNTSTSRWETTSQTIFHNGDSDWATITKNYPFLTMPSGLPLANPPAVCSTPPTFIENISGSDQIMLLIDRSGSMAYSVKKGQGEVCNNSKDDDGDSNIDERDCAQSRLDFTKAAARAFIDLQKERGIQLGILPFEEVPVRIQKENSEDVFQPIENLTVANASNFKHKVDALVAGGWTGIGRAIGATMTEFVRVEEVGRTRTVFLLSDGQNNSPEGSDPRVDVQGLKDNIPDARIFTIPVSDSADKDLLADIAADPAKMIESPTGEDLPAIYAELAAIYGGEALVLPRTQSAVGQAQGVPAFTGFLAAFLRESALPTSETYNFLVEGGAQSLTIFISGHNKNMQTWNVNFTLVGPRSEVFTQDSPQVSVDPFYRFIRVPVPSKGRWTLKISAPVFSLYDQFSYVLASVENPKPDCYVDILPKVQSSTDPVTIYASPYYVTNLDGPITIDGTIRRPDGTRVPISLVRDLLGGGFSASFNDYIGRGVYEVNLNCRVPEGALPAKGESIFEGPERSDIDVEPFQRNVTTSFFLAIGKQPECTTPDCNDGVPISENLITDQSNIPEATTSYGCGISGASLYQSFIPTRSFLASVELQLRVGGSFPESGINSTINIRVGNPTGEIIATATSVISGPVQTGQKISVRFDFLPTIKLISQETYIIEWLSPAPTGVPSGTFLTWLGRDDNPYSSGNAFSCPGAIIPNSDYNFQTLSKVR